ncbi:MAG TPA: TonB family protein [Cyclobacteriaceae bacterium]|nr:TonB family protein [Cyclobacteriaceae bacterium]
MTDYGHDIEKYLKGELTPAERHALEKKALNDPFLADALEGAEQINVIDFSKDVAQLKNQIAGKKTVSVWMWTARIAAGLAFILVATYIIWNVSETEPAQELALKNDKREVPPAATKDSTTSTADALSAPPVEQPAAGPAYKDQAPPKQQPATPLKTEPKLQASETKSQVTETKPQDKTGDVQTKNEPVTEIAAAKEAEEKAKADELKDLKVAESLAQNTKAAEEAASYRVKAEDDRDERSRSISKRKAVAADKEAAAPSAADRSAGLASGTSTNIIQGQVTSADDGSPLPGVNVVIKNSTIGTATDAEGNYQIKADGNQTLVYSFIGLQTKEVKVDERQEINVSMNVDATQLSEVVTVGYGVQSAGESVPPTIDLAHPEIGNRAYKQYLEKNIRYPEQAKTNKVDGRVTVEFTIEANGSLSNFTVIRGIGSGCDEELIRLIKEGPKWIPTKKDNVPVQDKAKVRLKFELPH